MTYLLFNQWRSHTALLHHSPFIPKAATANQFTNERSCFTAENQIIYYIGVIAYGILGFFVKRLIADFDSLKSEVGELREHLEKETGSIRDNYLKYEEFVRFQTSIDMKLTKIYEILVGR